MAKRLGWFDLFAHSIWFIPSLHRSIFKIAFNHAILAQASSNPLVWPVGFGLGVDIISIPLLILCLVAEGIAAILQYIACVCELPRHWRSDQGTFWNLANLFYKLNCDFTDLTTYFLYYSDYSLRFCDDICRLCQQLLVLGILLFQYVLFFLGYYQIPTNFIWRVPYPIWRAVRKC